MSFALRLVRLSGIVPASKSSSSSSNRLRFIALTSHWRGKLVPYKLADIGEGIREVTVKEWFVKQGDKVQQFDNICEVQSDKASVTITSRFDGIIKNIHYKVDEICQVGNILVDIEVESESSESEETNESDTTSDETKTLESSINTNPEISIPEEKIQNSHQESIVKMDNKVLTTPAVRKIAKENDIDLTTVPATGRDGRVLKEDILAYLAEKATKIDGQTAVSVANVTKKLSNVDKKYAKHMWKSMTQSLTIPHFVYSDECDVTRLVKLRAEVKEAFQSQGLALSYMPFFIKAISRALLQFPELNSHADEAAESVIVKAEHNISLAMDTPGGLVVPNIKNVQNLSIVDLAKELNRLQALGKKSSIPLQDLTGGTFSISNIGIVGGTYTKPVILPPQVVIGAVGKIQKLPRFDEHDNVIAANILSVSWAADHRVVDGVTMAKFSNLWKHYVENPSQLILGL